MNFYGLKRAMVNFLTGGNDKIRFIDGKLDPKEYGCEEGVTNIVSVYKNKVARVKLCVCFIYENNFCGAFIQGKSKDIHAAHLGDLKSSFDKAFKVDYIFLRDMDRNVTVFHNSFPDGKLAEKQSDLRRILKEAGEKQVEYYRQVVGDFSICDYFGEDAVVGGELVAKRFNDSVIIFSASHNITGPIFKVLKRGSKENNIARKASLSFPAPKVNADLQNIISILEPSSFSRPSTLFYGGINLSSFFTNDELFEKLESTIGINIRYLYNNIVVIPQDFNGHLVLHGFNVTFLSDPTRDVNSNEKHTQILDIQKIWVGIITDKMALKIYDATDFCEIPENDAIKEAKIVFLEEPTDKASKSFSLYEASVNIQSDLRVNNVRGFTNTSGTALEKISKMGVPYFSEFIVNLSRRKVCVKGKKKKDHLMGMSAAQIQSFDKILSIKLSDVIGEFIADKEELKEAQETDLVNPRDLIIRDDFLTLVSSVNLSDVSLDIFEDIVRFTFLKKPRFFRGFRPIQLSESDDFLGLLTRYVSTVKSFMIQDMKKYLSFFFKHKTEIAGAFSQSRSRHYISSRERAFFNLLMLVDKVETEKDIDRLAENIATLTDITPAHLVYLFVFVANFLSVTANNSHSGSFLSGFKEDIVDPVSTEYEDYMSTIVKMKELGYDKPIPIAIAYHNVKRELRHIKAYYSWLADKISAEKFSNSVEEYREKYEYSGEDFIVIAPSAPYDLVEEGINLSHCVGSYVYNVANNVSKILFVRRKESPHKSFATMEIQGNKISQLYGFGNTVITEPSFVMFIEEYKKEKNLL